MSFPSSSPRRSICPYPDVGPRTVLGLTSLLVALSACSSDPVDPGARSPSSTAGGSGSTDGSLTSSAGGAMSTTTSGPGPTSGPVNSMSSASTATLATSSSAGGMGSATTSPTSNVSVGGAGGSSTVSSSSTGDGAGGATTGAGGTGGGGSLPVQPSAGCGDASPQTGSAQSPLTVSGHQYYVKLPNGYDGNTPYVGLFMFNPTGNPIEWAEQNAGFEQNGAASGAVRIYPHPANSSSGWGAGDVAFFEPLYEAIVSSFCVDQARMFAAGESSGGDFSSILGCEHGDKLRGVAPCATKPVGQYPLNVSQRNCVGDVTAVVIHGANDNVVGSENGPATRDFYTELNGCGDMTEPVPGYTDTMSNCVEYQGCKDGYPVIWCQHTDPEYGGTNHGWPRFAADYLWELFSSY